MYSFSLSIASLSATLLASFVAASPTPSAFDTNQFSPKDIITRDVAVIGGGSSGTYSTFSLIDKGKSVVVIEKQGRLGGHTASYTDPVSGNTTEIGVQIYHDMDIVRDYFGRFDIPVYLNPGFFPSLANYDYRTGDEVDLEFQPSQEEITAAFAIWTEHLAKYPELDTEISLPDPVPEDLYIPLRDFVEKYGIQAAVPTMHYYNPGVGEILDNPTFEQMRYWSRIGMVNSIQSGFLSTVRHDSQELYEKAEVELSATSSLLLNSEVITASRGERGVKLVVRTPEGKKLIIAKKLLIAIPPKLDFVSPLDLSETEETLFGKFINAGYYAGILNHTSFSETASTSNAAEGEEYNFPVLPGAYNFSPTLIRGLQIFHYGTPQGPESHPISHEDVRAQVLDTIASLQAQNPDVFNHTEPEWVAFHDHAPYTLQVSGEEIRDGFYKDLYQLQGQRNTYWTGAAWRAEDSSLLWKFSEEVVLPQLLAGF
ncbi:hypothetical protein BJX99DRAFT_267125 [Aspergillus californicus]